MLPSAAGNDRNVMPYEKELLLKASEGDRQAFAALYTAYFPRLCRFVYFTTRSQTTAEEVIQEIFLKIWERKEKLAEIRSFEDYLFIMAKHQLFDQAKQQAARLKVVQDMITGRPDADNTIEGQLIYKEYHKAAIDAITKLPKRKQLIFFMRTQQSMSLNEIATVIRISRSAVKKHLYASIHFIKQQLHLE
jgi:RNA polymerase sigma-70 factor (ECF subfamily)